MYASQSDRKPEPLELEPGPTPAAPLNFAMQAWESPGQIDLSWSNPSELAANAAFSIVGVNLYRSFDSELGPFERLTPYPLGSNFWRDSTDNVLELEEVVGSDAWTLFGVRSAEMYAPRYCLKTKRRPIVKSGSQAIPADEPGDVQVLIDGVPVPILKVWGDAGEIEIDANWYPDVVKQTRFEPVLPTNTSVTTVSYRWNRNLVKTELNQRIFYRATTVATLGTDPTLRETRLEDAASISRYEGERLDWIWKESIRRNAWILSQGGERVKLFIRKTAGERCGCYRADYKEPLGDCLLCFGTGILYGYEGPYDLVIAPDDSEHTIDRSAYGMSVQHELEVWTGPKPFLTHRDFIVKRSGDRYSIGAIHQVHSRGVNLQQHFQIGHIDEKDVRYKVPIDNLRRFVQGHIRQEIPPAMNPPQDIGPGKPNIPDERELKGRTVTYENITY